MRTMRGAFLLVLAVLARDARAQSRPTDALAWLAGCWERRHPDGLVIEEHWSSPEGGTLLMFGKTTRRGTLIEHEFVRIYAVKDTLVYAANPSGQTPTEFRAVPPYDSVVTFANPAHDFPQRVIYRRGADSLFARVEGMRSGQLRGVDFRYARVKCAGP
jgi:hypothetical protein